MRAMPDRIEREAGTSDTEGSEEQLQRAHRRREGGWMDV